MKDKIQLIRDLNGDVIGQGHHRFIAVEMAGIEIPKNAITIVDIRPNSWPNSYNWSEVFWSGLLK